MTLLEQLMEMTGFEKAEEFKALDSQRKKDLAQMVESIPEGAFSLTDWNQAVTVLTGEKEGQTELQAKFFLVRGLEKPL